jgi:hypothetical protein
MLATGLIPNIDVLKLGHHGSNTSARSPSSRLPDPEVAIASAGLNNQFGHPHAEVLTRLGSVGANVLITDITSADDSIVMTSNCQTYQFSRVSGGATPTVTATPTSSATATSTPSATPTSPATCAATSATITALDKVGESVTISGSGLIPGWYVISGIRNRASDPAGYMLSGASSSTRARTRSTTRRHAPLDDGQHLEQRNRR